MLLVDVTSRFLAKWQVNNDPEDVRLSLHLAATLLGTEPDAIEPGMFLSSRSRDGSGRRLSGYKPSERTLRSLFSGWHERAGAPARSWHEATFADLCAIVGYWHRSIAQDYPKWNTTPWEIFGEIACTRISGQGSASHPDQLREHAPKPCGALAIGRDLGYHFGCGTDCGVRLDALVLCAREACGPDFAAIDANLGQCDASIVSILFECAAAYYRPPVSPALLRVVDEFEDWDCLVDVLVTAERGPLGKLQRLPRGELRFARERPHNPLLQYSSLGYLIRLVCDNAVSRTVSGDSMPRC